MTSREHEQADGWGRGRGRGQLNWYGVYSFVGDGSNPSTGYASPPASTRGQREDSDRPIRRVIPALRFTMTG